MAENNNEDKELDPIFKDQDLTKPRSYPRMKKKMKKIVMYIENQLGGQVLDLELKPEDIRQIVDQAFEELVHYMTDTYTVTVPYANCIDLSKYNIDNVESVLRGQDSILTGVPFQMPAMDLMNVTGMYNIENYANALLIKRNLNILATDMDFVWDKPNRKLYVYANPNIPSYVTINFKPEYYSVEDIREGYWETQLRKLSLAMCKIILGRIRSKYTSNSAKFQLDGPTLLAEGNAELTAVRQHLDDNKDIFTVLN
jgi:hypothetical protein